MDIDEIKSLQESFDKKHGWVIKTGNISEILSIISNDLIGLMGEIGEFANILKKITLAQDALGSAEGRKIFDELKEHLSEELIDAFIYILRIATHLKINIEDQYLMKLDINRRKFEKYEI